MNRVSILHLSDVHFQSEESSYQDDKKASIEPGQRESVFPNLEHVLEKRLNSGKVSVVAVTGDITTCGRKEGFASFTKTLFPSLLKLVGNARAICIVPGNHDVAWDADARHNDDYDRKFGPYGRFVEDAGVTSALIPIGRFRGGEQAIRTFCDRIPGPLYIDRKKKIMVLCINSAMRCGDVDIQLRDGVGTPVKTALAGIQNVQRRRRLNTPDGKSLNSAKGELDKALCELKRHSLLDIPLVTHKQWLKLADVLQEEQKKSGKNWRQYVKVALMHHHAVPFQRQVSEHKPFEIMADSSKVLELLASNGFQVVLTGHKHQPYRQRYQCGETEMLVLGGLTIGGYPARGHQQGICYIQFEQDDDSLSVGIADIECDSQVVTRDFVEGRMRAAQAAPVRLRLSQVGAENTNRSGSDRQKLNYEQVERGIEKLVKFARLFKPKTIIGINRGGAIVGGWIAKKLEIMQIRGISVDPHLASGKCVAGIEKQHARIGGKILLVDDAKRHGGHMREAYGYLRTAYKNAEIKTAVLIELDSRDPSRRKPDRPADIAAFHTNNSKLGFPWDPPSRNRHRGQHL